MIEVGDHRRGRVEPENALGDIGGRDPLHEERDRRHDDQQRSDPTMRDARLPNSFMSASTTGRSDSEPAVVTVGHAYLAGFQFVGSGHG